VVNSQSAGLGMYLLDAIAEQLAYVIFRSPQRRRLCAWRWRRCVRLHGGEHLTTGGWSSLLGKALDTSPLAG
jgi:hypothetical protein